ncbi:MAG: FKBP-type peptidyl-prolyl cis-trans isomerase [Chitinophagales bacterium]
MRQIIMLAFCAIALTFSSCEKSISFEEQFALDKETIRTWLALNQLTATETASGLNYIITQQGSGTATPSITDQVTVYYKGYLPEGEIFDQTAPGTPAVFPLSQVIQGWQEGFQLLKKNSKAILLIPSYLGYGTQANGSIPANSVLIFEVELLDF